MSRTLVLAAVVAMLALPMMPSAVALDDSAAVFLIARTFVSPVMPINSGGTVFFHSLETLDHHQPTAFDASWSVHLNPGDVGSVAITAPSGSVVLYRCAIHTSMVGVLYVA
jgi:hypothetical protein